jgi:hypothetical protein
MAVYRDPREALFARLLERFPGNPTVRRIIGKYKKYGRLPDWEWKTLESMDVGEAGTTLSPDFEKQVTVWLMDLGLTLQDVMELSTRKRGERLLASEQTTPPRVVVVRKPAQAKTIKELRELVRTNRKNS